ncbi:MULTISPECIES: murein hydrolase activator EnvC family protein [Chitinophaga]|uniref:murein hydrolase activator EnvC family protein n=1 Tax=Chitinophaga TaxID=79328 RepID=UPI00135637B7|nr:peptidoglycan DD-metalloendopeptidase family protein [Chitinophaga ginsengisegetis]MDR6570315.1 septal ring factor EnvC (AmiA/AmiB activator) [Chitinophaga ginsengisegetis]MDR6650049.1 septal ring factor EnvC (AmiA/AmiB activator) [Chitinophaga ginsengisegetis]MDR6656310.1 septal ring factor EnvC (AmiA/AmiB activator) [Chitinophaga ginsengisegetis]
MKKIIPFMLVLWLMPAMLVAQNTGQQQQSREELERRKKELQREIDEANEQLKETKKSTKESLGQLRALRDKITLRSRLINNINEEINFINGDINTAARDVKTLQKDLDTLKAQYAQLVIYAYKNRSSYDMLNFVFSAENFNDAVKRFQYLKQYREYRRRQADNIVSTQEQLNQKIQNLESQRVRRSDALKTEQEQRNTLEVDKKEKDEVLNKLKGREKELVADINQRKKDAQKVQLAIRAVIRREIEEARRKAIEEETARRKAAEEKRRREEEARKAAALAAAERAKAAAANNNNNNVANNTPAPPPPPVKAPEPAPEPEKTVTRTENVLEATPEALALSESFEANRGKLPWPVDAGNIIEHFGIHQHAVMEHIQVPSDGIVIATNKGGAVKSIFDGEVKSVVVMPGSGYVIIIRHGQYFTTYVRLQTTRVKKGDNVKTGQVIGTASTNDIENTGEVELQIWKGITKQNPEQWIRRR